MATEQDWAAYADQAGVAYTDSLLVRTAAGAGAEVSGSDIFARRTSGGPFTAEGDVNIASNAATVAGGLRYFDVTNTENTNGASGSIFRLITKNAAGSTLVAVNLVKYKNGQFSITNDETGAGGCIVFGIGGAERARFTANGQLLVGTGSDWTGNFARIASEGSGTGFRAVSAYNSGTTGSALIARVDNTAPQLAAWYYGTTIVGSITTSGTATAYNTSSDYRLKEDPQPVDNALARLLAVPVWNFAWKATGARTDGFMAHELAEVVPCAVTGDKDAMQEMDVVVEPERVTDVLGPDGAPVTIPAVTEKRLVPAYQGVDQAKLVPLLVAAVQELAAKVAALEARA